jgi:hypothetical protein
MTTGREVVETLYAAATQTEGGTVVAGATVGIKRGRDGIYRITSIGGAGVTPDVRHEFDPADQGVQTLLSALFPNATYGHTAGTTNVQGARVFGVPKLKE